MFEVVRPFVYSFSENFTDKRARVSSAARFLGLKYFRFRHSSRTVR